MLRDSFGQLRPNLRTVGDGAEGGTPAAPAGSAAPEGGTPAGDAPAAPAGGDAQDVASLPQWAQRIIADTRAEAAKHRTEKATAATAAEKAFADKLAVALGLKPDAAADPAALTQQVTAAQQSAKDASLRLAIYQAAGRHQGNPDALLDSNTFLASVQSLDPTSSDFPTQVDTAIKAAVTNNPALKAAQAAAASAVDHAGGSGETGPISEQQLKSMSAEQIVAAQKAGLLKHLL